MKRLMLLPAAAMLASCNTPTFNLVSIKPIYGWVDGCTDVKVSGSAFADDATVQIGGVDVEVTSRPTEGLDVGYWLTTVTPPSPTGTNGYADVTVNSAGASDTVTGAFYYVACPMAGYIEVLDPAEVSAGTAVNVWGCGLDVTTLKVKLVSQADPKVSSTPADLVSDCSTARTHFDAPDMAPGTYDVLLVDSSDTIVYPSDYGCVPDTATPCLPVYTVTYGGAS